MANYAWSDFQNNDHEKNSFANDGAEHLYIVCL